MAILGTARHGKSHTINQMLRATELPDRSYNPMHDKHKPWDCCVGPTAIHAARAVARTLCIEADERERRDNVSVSMEDREYRFDIIFNGIMARNDIIGKTDIICADCVIETLSKHPRIIWNLPNGPSKGDESNEPVGDAAFNSKGRLNPSCTDTAFMEEAEREQRAVETFTRYATGSVGSIGGSDGEFLVPSRKSDEGVTPLSIKISGGEQ